MTDIEQSNTGIPDQQKAIQNGRVAALKAFQEQRTPLDMIDVREGRGGQEFFYLRHQYVTEKLNELAGHDWDFRILRERVDEDFITVLGELTVRAGSHTVTKTQYGSSKIKRKRQKEPLNVGDDFKAAASDALKKCASLLGLGLDLSMPVRPATLRGLHAAGTDVFGDRWDDKRHRAVRAITRGSSQSSADLTEAEARVLKAIITDQHSSAPIVKHMRRKLS